MNLPVMTHLMCWLEADRVFLCLDVQKMPSVVVQNSVKITRPSLRGFCS